MNYKSKCLAAYVEGKKGKLIKEHMYSLATKGVHSFFYAAVLHYLIEQVKKEILRRIVFGRTFFTCI